MWSMDVDAYFRTPLTSMAEYEQKLYILTTSCTKQFIDYNVNKITFAKKKIVDYKTPHMVLSLYLFVS